MSDWTVEVSAEADGVPPALLADLDGAVRAVLAAEGAPEIELSIALVSDETMADLNLRYLAHEGPTDVISFPLEQPGAPLVGDVYVGHDQAVRQAAENGIPLREELLRLVIHGTLHILGWDHPEEEGRADSPMYRRQEELLTKLWAGAE